MRLRPECYRKRTYGAESSPTFSSLLLVGISRSGPASVCALVLNCDNARTCNSPEIVQRMPMSGHVLELLNAMRTRKRAFSKFAQ
jgi:hypothetical protein